MSEKPVRLSVTLNDRNPRHQIIIDWLSTNNYKVSSVIVEALVAYIEQETAPLSRKKTKAVTKRLKKAVPSDEWVVMDVAGDDKREGVSVASPKEAAREIPSEDTDVPALATISEQENSVSNALEPTHRVKDFLKGLKFEDDDD